MEFWKDLGGGTGAPAAAVSFGMAKPGTASTNDVVFSTYLSGQPWNERMRITNAGNVGVGTNDPQAKLDVVGAVNASTQYNLAGQRVLSVPALSSTFVGVNAGTNNNNLEGIFNTFVGNGAGRDNTTGFLNTFVGNAAGLVNKQGSANSFFGTSAGNSNLSGGSNTFVGMLAGDDNVHGSNNTVVGASADVGSDNLNNATAIGAQAVVTQDNSLVLGAINGTNLATASTSVGIGVTAPGNLLHVRGTGTGSGGFPAAAEVIGHFEQPSTSQHAAISVDAASGRDAILYLAESGTAVWGLRHDADDADKFQLRYHGSGVGDITATRLTVQTNGNVGIGMTSPTATLHIGGNIKVNTLGAAGATPLCRNASNEIATCASPPAAPTESGAAAAAASPQQQEQIESQRREIEAQRQRIEQLEQRLKALESLLGGRGPAPSPGARP